MRVWLACKILEISFQFTAGVMVSLSLCEWSREPLQCGLPIRMSQFRVPMGVDFVVVVFFLGGGGLITSMFI